MVRFYTGRTAGRANVLEPDVDTAVDDKSSAPAGLNVRAMRQTERRPDAGLSLSDRVSDLVTRLAGSMLFVWIHVLWFAVWIGLNTTGFEPFDEFPFGFLTMIVSLEAIFLSAFVLISQNRQAETTDRRAQLDMQVGLIAEQELTKLVSMVADLHGHFGLHGHDDPEVTEMVKPTDLQDLARVLDEHDDVTDPDDTEHAADDDGPRARTAGDAHAH